VAVSRRNNGGVHLQRKECNKYDLTAAQCFSLVSIIMIGPGGLLLVVPPPVFAIPVSVLLG